jgi:GMP synthase (glutamine-hydrolysing)
VILVVDMNGKKASLEYYEFVLPILEIVLPIEKCTVKHYSEVTQSNIRSCSTIILSGTALKDNATLDQPEKFLWLKTVNKPVLGICAGMEAIGHIFGSDLTECLEIGMTPIVTLKQNTLFSGVFKAYSLHNYCVKPSSAFEVLAESPKCPQAIKHKLKPIYGVLFHPEVRNAEILTRFLKLKQ